MASISLKPNSTNDSEFYDFEIEASEAEDDDVPAGLVVTVRHGDADSVDVFEASAETIREFRDLVVAECDKALALIED